ncbi:MAG: hypothetical protein WKG07_08295 [Hymenobacter sp.]
MLQANAVLVLFAAAYYGLLRRLTFFTLNRAYLLGALVFAAVYPALPVPALLPAEAVALLPAALVAAAPGRRRAAGQSLPLVLTGKRRRFGLTRRALAFCCCGCWGSW